MKRYYEKLSLTPFSFDMEGPVLEGSYTNKAVKVNSVTVDDFDQGFDDTIAPDGFQDITFD